jgi:multidrug transporter EmrE-like cation transporter
MARLLTILLVGLVFEAIGVVFLSRGLKEIVWFFSSREIRDAESLAASLSSRSNHVSELVWQRLTPRQRAKLTAAGSAATEKRRVLAQALNGCLEQDELYDPKQFADVQLSPETRALLARRAQANETLRLNRLLLQDAYPDELTKARPEKISPAQVLGLVGRGVTNPHILLGMFFEALFFAALLTLMSLAEVSFVWPLTSLGFVITTVAARIYLHEQVSVLRWSGVCLIMIGAALISWTEKQPDAAPAPLAHSTGPALK